MNDKSDVESIKENSRQLRGRLQTSLTDQASHMDRETQQLLKFHGVYQQDDRDLRRQRRQQGLEPAYSCMVRTKIPGGLLSAEQYLSLDALADTCGNGTLRVTNRQDIQFHGILKEHLQTAVEEINRALLVTLGACGDVVRNVVCCPAPHADRDVLQRYARGFTERFLPSTRAYHEIWLNGEKVVDTKDDDDPLYGGAYLPRKFKIGLALPHDNCVEVHAQDVGLLAVMNGSHLEGFNVLVGGGLGMNHGKADTYPRLASPIGFAPTEAIYQVVEGIITLQRDFGNRQDRRHARLKYLLDGRGMDWFAAQLHDRLGFVLQPSIETEPLQVQDHLGWQVQTSDRGYLGLPVENGRIVDQGNRLLRTALRKIVSQYRPSVRLTPQQNVLLADVPLPARADIDSCLRAHGVRGVEAIAPTSRWAMACPALPTCGLAITEAERVLPEISMQIEGELEALGLGDEAITIRMTGCPNGCARPYTSELAFVGRSRDRYTIYVGGRFAGTTLNQPYADLVPLDQLVATVRPLLTSWKEARAPDERFGDFCRRVGIETLRQEVAMANA